MHNLLCICGDLFKGIMEVIHTTCFLKVCSASALHITPQYRLKMDVEFDTHSHLPPPTKANAQASRQNILSVRQTLPNQGF